MSATGRGHEIGQRFGSGQFIIVAPRLRWFVATSAGDEARSFELVSLRRSDQGYGLVPDTPKRPRRVVSKLARNVHHVHRDMAFVVERIDVRGPAMTFAPTDAKPWAGAHV